MGEKMENWKQKTENECKIQLNLLRQTLHTLLGSTSI